MTDTQIYDRNYLRMLRRDTDELEAKLNELEGDACVLKYENWELYEEIQELIKPMKDEIKENKKILARGSTC